MRHFIHQFLIALDQLANVLLGGYADETLSARAYRADQNGRILGRVLRPFIDMLFFWQEKHCRAAYIAEFRRRHFPAAYSLFDRK